jgi:hypothetical protein
MLRPGVKLGLLFSLVSILSYSSPATPQAPLSADPAAQQPTASTSQGNTLTHHAAPNRHSKKKTEPEVVQAPPPPPPPTPEQLPPAQPNVSYQNGQLTIQSDNSTLAQILRSVQAKTGASVEIPGSANNERVVAQLGPGLPRDVINSLLNGSKFDYIILGVSDKPGAVQKVILTPRQNANPTPANSAQAGPPPSGTPMQEEAQPEDDNSYVSEPPQDENTAEQNVQPQPSFIPAQPMQPGQQPNGTAPVVPTVGPQPGVQGPQGVKTPEQLLQELQRMQQQQQQYQQQLNPANQQPAEQPQPQ